MPHVAARTSLQAPPSVVFAALSDFRNAPQRISGIKRVEIQTDGPVGLGTRFRETRVMFGKEASEVMTVTQWDPPRSYTLECDSCGCHYRSTVSCRPDDQTPGASIVEMTFDARPLTFMAKLFSPLGKLMMGACRKAFEKDLSDIKQSIESGSLASPAGAQPA